MSGTALASMQHNDITGSLLGRLARLRAPGEERVLSLYLDLDPSENMALPPARRSAINALIDEARRRAEDEPLQTREARIRLRADIERLEDVLVRGVVEGRLAAGARGLAALACERAGLLEVVRLPRPVRSRAFIARHPVIQPLAEIGSPGLWAVLVTDGDDARLLEGVGDRLIEIESFHDAHRRRHRRGVWAPERSDGPLAEDERRHVRRAVEELVERDRRQGYELVAIGATEPVWAEARRAMPDGLRTRLAGRFSVNVEEASAAEVRLRVEPLLLETASEQERRTLALLDEAGVKGLGPSLELAFERRISALVITPELEHPGVLCQLCGWPGLVPGACPIDGAALWPEDNIVDWAIRRALAQDAEALALHHHPDGLAAYDGIGAIPRF